MENESIKLQLQPAYGVPPEPSYKTENIMIIIILLILGLITILNKKISKKIRVIIGIVLIFIGIIAIFIVNMIQNI